MWHQKGFCLRKYSIFQAFYYFEAAYRSMFEALLSIVEHIQAFLSIFQAIKNVYMGFFKDFKPFRSIFKLS